MALISGRPISFQMNLYDALFLKRPVVEPELFASLRPPTYSGGLGGNNFTPPTATAPPMPSGGAPMAESLRRNRAMAGLEADKAARYSGFGFGVGSGEGKSGGWRGEDERMNLSQGVQSAATASKLGDFFQYAIDHSVTLPRQKSALLPIVAKDVEGERVSIYNERTHPKFPLLGLVFKNTTGMHLSQGPITVYEGSTYAGDARILDLQTLSHCGSPHLDHHPLDHALPRPEQQFLFDSRWQAV